MTLSFAVYQEGKNTIIQVFPVPSLQYIGLTETFAVLLSVYRIYVDLPDADNRLKILKIFLTPENLETGFEFEKLAKETEGYSGSDLKVCVIQGVLLHKFKYW